MEQGKLSLNDELRKLAPEIPIDNPWEATDPVRVVHVLEHTAGFNDMGLNRSITGAGSVNAATVLLGISPLAFCVFTLAGLILTIRYFGQFRSRVVA